MTHDRTDAMQAPFAAAAREHDLTSIGAAVAAILFGAFLLYGVAFAPLPAMHAAAHDARHAFAFPCH